MADPHLAMFDTRFSSISAYIFRIWRIKPMHHISMPCTSRFDRRFGTPESILAYGRKHPRKIRAKLRTVLVPVSHSISYRAALMAAALLFVVALGERPLLAQAPPAVSFLELRRPLKLFSPPRDRELRKPQLRQIRQSSVRNLDHSFGKRANLPVWKQDQPQLPKGAEPHIRRLPHLPIY